MKKRLREIEDEAGALREMQAKVEKEMGSAQGLGIGCTASAVQLNFALHFLFALVDKTHSILAKFIQPSFILLSSQYFQENNDCWNHPPNILDGFVNSPKNPADARLLYKLRHAPSGGGSRILSVHHYKEVNSKVKCDSGQAPIGYLEYLIYPTASASQAEKEEVDSRSIYVGNKNEYLVYVYPEMHDRIRQVDYACTPEEVQQHFQSCGTVNRVTILTDKFGQPKGYAYVEFVEMEAVQNALLLNESELHGRQLKVSAKRTNVPGMKQFRGRRFNPYAGFRPRRAFVPGAPVFPPFGVWGCLKVVSRYEQFIVQLATLVATRAAKT
ncbi:Polyadenylate-binding protein 2 [Capsicum annuum]|nr:Polyadenylate-binding protein 2 [Capsicum annuum]